MFATHILPAEIRMVSSAAQAPGRTHHFLAWLIESPPAKLIEPLMLCRLKPHTIVKCITTVVIGLVVGLLAVALGRITETTIVWKNTFLRSIVHSPDYSLEWGITLAAAFHVGYSVLLVVFGSSLVGLSTPAHDILSLLQGLMYRHAAARHVQRIMHSKQIAQHKLLICRCSTVPLWPMEQGCPSSWRT